MPFGSFANGGTVTQLRGLAWLALSEELFVGQRTYVSDSGGGATQSWSYGGTIPCRIDALGMRAGREGVVGERMSDRSTHLVTAPSGTNVDASDRVWINGRGTFEVTAVEQRTDEWMRIFEVVQVF